jgi:protein SCO1/2
MAMLIIAAVLLYSNQNGGKNALPENIRDVAIVPALPLRSVDLHDHETRAVKLDNFTGRWSLVTFGYTHCPDICPATLAQMRQLYRAFRDYPEPLSLPQFYFVSVDPQRDALEYLGEYTRYFDPSFIGLSGDNQALQAFEKQFGVAHSYVQQRNTENYIVIHSAKIFLIDPRGHIVAGFEPPMDIRRVAGQYAGFVHHHAGHES